MVGLWVLVVALLSGICGAGAVMFAARLRPGHAVSEREVPRSPQAVAVGAEPSRDRWFRAGYHCDQAVCRAARAVDSVSSVPARRELGGVVRRMEAELPNVRALAELGRVLEGDGRSASRVRRQLEETSARFATTSDHVLGCVVELVAEPDLERVHERMTVVRQRFPLVRPMSTVVRDEPGSLVDVSG